MEIEAGKDDLHLTPEEKIVPYKAILKDRVVWGILFSVYFKI